MIRVLIADDSPTARHLMREILASDPLIQVVGEAHDGREAISMTERLDPDLIVMDVHMPAMDGLEATREIMIRCPRPIVVVSAVGNEEEMELSLSATQAGALLAVPKPVGPGSERFAELSSQLVSMVKAMAGLKVVRRWRAGETQGRVPTVAVQRSADERVSIVAIAASTGGPPALRSLLGDLPADFPVPILIVQHIARDFALPFADWLRGGCSVNVKLAENGESPVAGVVYVAPDDRHLTLVSNGRISLSTAPPTGGFRPAATVLFDTVGRVHGRGMVGVILTGMGSDGADGLASARRRGAYVIAQDESSSVVFGMAHEAILAGAVDVVLPLDAIAPHLRELVSVRHA